MGHKGNRCQTEYGAATWRTTWPWRSSAGSDCFLVCNCCICFFSQEVHVYICWIRMIHTAQQELCQMPQESCTQLRQFRHWQRCCSLLWHGMSVSCLTLKQWTAVYAKDICMSSSTDRLSWTQYNSSASPMTMFALILICLFLNLLAGTAIL